jgi:hypothetical protein
LARRKKLAVPVKSSVAAKSFGIFRAASPAASGRSKEQQLKGVVAAVKRPERFRMKAIVHSQASINR